MKEAEYIELCNKFEERKATLFKVRDFANGDEEMISMLNHNIDGVNMSLKILHDHQKEKVS